MTYIWHFIFAKAQHEVHAFLLFHNSLQHKKTAHILWKPTHIFSKHSPHCLTVHLSYHPSLISTPFLLSIFCCLFHTACCICPPHVIRARCSHSANLKSPLPPNPVLRALTSLKLRPCHLKLLLSDLVSTPWNPSHFAPLPHAHPPHLRSSHRSLASSFPMPHQPRWNPSLNAPIRCPRWPLRVRPCPHLWEPLSITPTLPLPPPLPPVLKEEVLAHSRWLRPLAQEEVGLAWQPAAPPTGGPDSIHSRTTCSARHASTAASCRVGVSPKTFLLCNDISTMHWWNKELHSYVCHVLLL